MTPQEAIYRVLKSVDGVEIGVNLDEARAAILKAGVALCGIALLRVPDLDEREDQLSGIEGDVRVFIERVLARRSPFPRAANGRAAH